MLYNLYQLSSSTLLLFNNFLSLVLRVTSQDNHPLLSHSLAVSMNGCVCIYALPRRYRLVWHGCVAGTKLDLFSAHEGTGAVKPLDTATEQPSEWMWEGIHAETQEAQTCG